MRATAFALAALLLAGCGGLLPKAPPPPAFYTLDAAPPARARAAAPPAAAGAPVLVVAPPQAAAGFDSARIVYVRQPQRLEHFAHSEWVDTPARLLAPLIVAALQDGTAFGAVLAAPAAGALRLDTQVVRLQQEFGAAPSRVRFTLRATLLDADAQRVLGTREFDATVAAASDDPYGGVVAARDAVQRVLSELAAYCAEAAAARR